MKRKGSSYLGGHTVIGQSPRKQMQNIVEGARQHKRWAQRAQSKLDKQMTRDMKQRAATIAKLAVLDEAGPRSPMILQRKKSMPYPRKQSSYSSAERELGSPERRAAIKAWADYMRKHDPRQVASEAERIRWNERYREGKLGTED